MSAEPAGRCSRPRPPGVTRRPATGVSAIASWAWHRSCLISRQRCAPCRREECMQIRAGYEIAYDCPQPTPMLLMLSVHPSRMADLADAAPHRLRSADRAPGTTATASATSAPASSPRRPASDDLDRFHRQRPRPARRRRAGRRAARRSRTCPTTCWSSCSAAATARPTACPTSPGRCSAARRRAGRGCRRSATTSTTASTFGYQHAARDAHRLGRLSASSAASAATSPTSRSRSAAA